MPLPFRLLVVTWPLLIRIVTFDNPSEKSIDSRVLTPFLIPDEVGWINNRIIVVLLALY